MRGIDEYNAKQKGLVESLIQKNADKPYLMGFNSYIDHMSMTTKYRYMNFIIRLMNGCQKTPEDLTVDDYTAFMYSIREKTSGYRVTAYAALKIFSQYLAVSGKNPNDYMQHVKKPKSIESQATKEKREHAYLEKREIDRYINAIKTSVNDGFMEDDVFEAIKARDMAIVMVLLNTGMRISALYKLNVSDINRDEMIITVTDKGSKVFTYNISDELLDIIDEWLEERDLFVIDPTQEALFLSRYGDRISPRRIGDRIKKYAECIGKDISPHKLRATYGTMIYRQTKDIRFTQIAMNHSNPSTTELYIRGDEKINRKQASDIMSKIIFKK